MEEQITKKQSPQFDELQNWSTNARDLLLDLKCLIKEYYAATLVDDGNALKINFKNGQSFTLSIKTDA